MTSTNKSFIYRLLDIAPGSRKIVLLFFPPLYALWLLAIGKTLLRKQNQPEKMFTFFAVMTVICFTLIFLPYSSWIKVDISKSNPFILAMLLIIYFFWFSTIGMLSNLTIKYERLATPDRYYGLVDKLDYVKRFLTFFYWPFSIWSYQKTVNEYAR